VDDLKRCLPRAGIVDGPAQDCVGPVRSVDPNDDRAAIHGHACLLSLKVRPTTYSPLRVQRRIASPIAGRIAGAEVADPRQSARHAEVPVTSHCRWRRETQSRGRRSIPAAVPSPTRLHCRLSAIFEPADSPVPDVAAHATTGHRWCQVGSTHEDRKLGVEDRSRHRVDERQVPFGRNVLISSPAFQASWEHEQEW
jgi:hypothetical protein